MRTPAELGARFEKLCQQLADDAAAAVAGAYQAWQAGTITDAALVALLTDVLTAATHRGRIAGDAYAAGALADQTGRPTRPVGARTVTADRARFSKAARQIVQDAANETRDTAMQLERIARNEPIAAAQQQALDTYRSHGVTGYRRQTDADPCELCVWLVKAHLDPEGIGYIYPTSKPMHRHIGCNCTPIPATRGTHR